MQIKKADLIYKLVFNASVQQSTFDLFDSPPNQTLYFRSYEEAALHQEKYFPRLKVYRNFEISYEYAVVDKDEKGDERWVLISKTENMDNSNVNEQYACRDYKPHTLAFYTTPSLDQAIQKNPSSVFVVKECNRDEWEGEGELGKVSFTRITYDCSEAVGKDTRFLYVSGAERWFVESGQEIKMTDALALKLDKLDHDIQGLQQQLQALLAEKDLIMQTHQQLGMRNGPI